MKINIIIGLVLMFVVIGCSSHTAKKGTVAMKISDTEAHIFLGKNKVKVGDKISAYYNDCQYQNLEMAYGAPCMKTKLGTGVVTKLLNDSYSVVRFKEGVKFSEKTLVEKL